MGEKLNPLNGCQKVIDVDDGRICSKPGVPCIVRGTSMEVPTKQLLCPRHRQKMADEGLVIVLPDSSIVEPRAGKAPKSSESETELLLFAPEPDAAK